MPDYSGFSGGSGTVSFNTQNDDSHDATAYGGRYSGFDPAYTGPGQKYAGYGSFQSDPSFSISSLFNNLKTWNERKDSVETPSTLEAQLNTVDPTTISQNLTLDNTQETDPNKGLFGWFQDKNSLGYRLGLRDPGSLAAQNFFDHQTPAEQNDRMGLIGQGIDAIGNAAIRAMTPAPVSMGMSLANIYDAYQKDGNLQNAIMRGLTATGGYGAAIGNALQGNWGASLSSLLGKQGVDPMTSAALGTSVDAATGKPTSPSTYGGLAGYFAGRGAGGPVGAVFGANLGRTLGSMYSGKK